VKVAVDTNILVRALMRDEPKQSTAAAHLLRNAERIAISIPCLCEFNWVLSSVYRLSKLEIATAITELVQTKNVALDRIAVEAGLAMLYAGGDFADGVLSWEGNILGGETFVSFDKQAVKLLTRQGHSARLLS
jgi:predicted nucleic-acid-binding protein